MIHKAVLIAHLVLGLLIVTIWALSYRSPAANEVMTAADGRTLDPVSSAGVKAFLGHRLPLVVTYRGKFHLLHEWEFLPYFDFGPFRHIGFKPPSRRRFHLLSLPLWAPLVLLPLYPSWTVVRDARRRHRRRKKGLCLQCGYDLTGNVSGVCPECGERV